MTASFWVYISTICFLALVYVFCKKMVLAFFNAKKKEIAEKFEEVRHNKAQAEALYEEYRQKMDDLETKTSHIIKEAELAANNIIINAEHDIEQYKYQKNKELDSNIKKYETELKQKIYSKYADVIVHILGDKAASQKEISIL